MELNITQHDYSESHMIISENIMLRKKIQILEAENKQLLQEYNMYKQAYERWACNRLILFIKRLLRR